MGLRLLSDVTAYPGEQYRSGPVNRLVSVILRAARIMGESAVFHSNGPALWGRVQQLLQNLMARLWSLNALDGATPSQAFSARCDRTTMTQNNLDNGQLIAAVTFTAAATLETIRVQLAMEAGSTSAQEIAANASTGGAILGNAVGGMAGAIP
jgi:phage tail sheath protein FI